MPTPFRMITALVWLAVLPSVSSAQRPVGSPLPLRQSKLDASAPSSPLSINDVSRLDRWIGSGVRDARWSPDGVAVYFRWSATPAPADNPDNDPWWRVDRLGRSAEPVADADVWRVPGATVAWSRDGRLAAWESRGRVVVWDASRAAEPTRIVAEGSKPVGHVRVAASGRAVDFMQGEDLYRWSVDGTVRRLTAVTHRPADTRTDQSRRLADQQLEIFDILRERADAARTAAAISARRDPSAPQVIPISEGTVEDIQASPDGRFLTVRTVTTERRRKPTLFMDYVTPSGYAEAKESRGKVGEPRDVVRLGVVRVDARTLADSVAVRWITLPEATGRPVDFFGPWWSVEGDRAVIEAVSQDDHDAWIARLDPAAATISVIDHQHDDAWIGGPPIQANYDAVPSLIEWLPGGRLVFASEQGGWSHLHLAEPDGQVRSLTSGAWEVRAATLSRDRTTWLIGASREHPSDDHLYTMPAAGGPLVRLTVEEGRSEGVLSPDGKRIAVVYSRNDRLPDLWLRDTDPAGVAVRVTQSGSDNYWTHRWLRPEIVTIPHPDGRPVWAGLYRPEHPDPKHPAIMYVHGGGYRQFAHRGWSVYGYSHASHYGMINWLVQQGYTVLDFDYRGSSGYGRDYRTDIYRSMGAKDVDGAVAATRWLTRTQGVDSTRIGIYGVSYGGFMTLMSLFRYPGVFAAGIAAAGVTDWSHYSDDWTSRVLGVPADDPEVYRRTSPIYHAAGLKDALLIEHGLVDDNVEFQDAARLVQRLIELKKPFEEVFYPLEPHVIESEASLLDFHTRLAAFFQRHLVDR